MRSFRPVVPTLDDPGVGELSEVVGGPGGRYARTRWIAPLLVGMLVAGLMVILGAGLRFGCEKSGWEADSSDFAPPCFSAMPADYVAFGGAEGVWPYGDAVGELDEVAGQQVANGAVRYAPQQEFAFAGATYLRAGLASLVVDGDQAGVRSSIPTVDLYRDDGVRAEASAVITWAAAILGLALIALVLVVARFRAARPWDGVLVAAAPVVLLAGLVDITLVGVALAAAAVLVARRGGAAPGEGTRSVTDSAPWLAGALLGAALSFSLFALPVAAAVLVACACTDGIATRSAAPRWIGRCLLALLGTWIVISLPALTSGGVWFDAWREVLGSSAPDGSLWAMVEAVRGGEVPAYGGVAFVALIAWVVIVAVVTRRQRRAWAPRPEQVVFAVVAVAVVLFGAGPSAALWVLPFAVLAMPRIVPLLSWQLVEIAYACAYWWTTNGDLLQNDEVVEGPLAALTLLRVVGLLALVALVLRDLAMPTHDPLGEERRPVPARLRPAR